MANERLCLCKQCGNKFPKSQLVKYKSKNMCKTCFETEQKLDIEKNDLCETIKQIYNVPYVNPGYLKQINQYRENYNFTYSGMKLTLLYCKNVLNMQFDSNKGLGIIPYKYEAAKNDYIKKKQLAEQTKTKNVDVKTVKRIVTSIQTENTYLKNKIINLEEI